MLLSGILPLLVVFDLDNTLWPMRDDSQQGPYSKSSNGTLIDWRNIPIPIYFSEVPKVLDTLKQNGIKIAVASSAKKDIACQLLEEWQFNKYISYQEIQFGEYKQKHFAAIQNASGINYADMLIFEDDGLTIRIAEELGMTGFLVPDYGMCMDVLELGIQLFQVKRKLKENPQSPRSWKIL